MCYDISLIAPLEKIQEHFPNLEWYEGIEQNITMSAHIMGHSFPLLPVVYKNRQSNRICGRLMEWGCIPHYISDEETFRIRRNQMLNARSERMLTDSSSYWFKIRNRRCLLPVTGIYEHHEAKGMKKKIPFWIGLQEQSIFFLAGLYSVAQLVDKKSGEVTSRFTFSILTQTASTEYARIHNSGSHAGRMPLFLHQHQWLEWLNDNTSLEELEVLVNESNKEPNIKYFPVYTIRGKSDRPDGLTANAPYDWGYTINN